MALPVPLQKQRPQTTAHLTQTMALLRLTGTELKQHIEAELAANPALELIEDHRCPTCNRIVRVRGVCPRCSAPHSASPDEPVVFVSTQEDLSFSRSTSSDDDLPLENAPSPREDLPTYVLRQIASELEPDERPLAASLLTSLDGDGLLDASVLEIARFHHTSPNRVEQVLRKIQRADPAGVGSPTPGEALLVQLDLLSENYDVPPHAARAITEAMDLLGRHQYSELGRRLGITTQEAEATARFISDNLNPFPGRAHWGTVRQSGLISPPVYHRPDIIISLLNEDDPNSPLMVEILLPISGTLRVNPLFRRELRRASAQLGEKLKSDLDNAALLVKCLRQRNNTMVRLMELVVGRQRRFIIHGNAHLRPTTRASVADALGVHESTVSRAVSGKSVQIPNGRIIPLAQFFDRSLHIRTALRTHIEQETKPLSDAKLAKLLEGDGFQVARRTVAKYRAMEGILPAHLRRQQTISATA